MARTSTKRSRPARAAQHPAGADRSGTASTSAPRVKVRMYRQGLGDCFLISIQRDTKPFYILIDCGVILGTQNAGDILATVVQDVIDTTGGVINVLVVTHEHY